MNLYLIENDQTIPLILNSSEYDKAIDHIICINYLPYYTLQNQKTTANFSFIEDWFDQKEYDQLHYQTDKFTKQWYRKEDKDITTFEGISYGQIIEPVFSRHYLVGILVKYGELIRKAVEQYHPTCIHFDFSNQRNSFFYYLDDAGKFFNKEKIVIDVSKQLNIPSVKIIPPKYIPSAFNERITSQSSSNMTESILFKIRSIIEKTLNLNTDNNGIYFFAYFNQESLLQICPEQLVIPHIPLKHIFNKKFLLSKIKFFDLNQSDDELTKEHQAFIKSLQKSKNTEYSYIYNHINYTSFYSIIINEIICNQLVILLRFKQALQRNLRKLKIQKLICNAIGDEKAQLLLKLCSQQNITTFFVDHGIQGHNYYTRASQSKVSPIVAVMPSKFNPYNGLSTKVMPLGNPVMDNYPVTNRKRIKQIKKILFLTFEENFYLRFNRYMYQEAYLKEVYKAFPYLIENNIEIYYKPHHENQQYHKYMFNFFKVDTSKINYIEGYNFTDLIKEVDLMVCSVSSCFYEAQAAGVPTIFLEPKMVENTLHPPMYSQNPEEVLRVSTGEELIEIIKKNKDNPDSLNQFLDNFLCNYAQKYMGKLDGKASNRIMNSIINS